MGFRVSLKNNRLLKPVGAETVNTVSLLAAVCDTLSAAYGCCFPPVCLNVVFLSLPPSQAALFRSLSEKEVAAKSYPIQPVIQL